MSDVLVTPAVHDGPIRNDEVRDTTSKPKLYCSTVDPETETTCSCTPLRWHDQHYPYCGIQKSGRDQIPGSVWSEMLPLQDTKPNPGCPRLGNALNMLPELVDVAD